MERCAPGRVVTWDYSPWSNVHILGFHNGVKWPREDVGMSAVRGWSQWSDDFSKAKSFRCVV